MNTAIEIPRCHICGCSPPHPPASCPLVESVEYHGNGSVAKITKREPVASPVITTTVSGEILMPDSPAGSQAIIDGLRFRSVRQGDTLLGFPTTRIVRLADAEVAVFAGVRWCLAARFPLNGDTTAPHGEGPAHEPGDPQ